MTLFGAMIGSDMMSSSMANDNTTLGPIYK